MSAVGNLRLALEEDAFYLLSKYPDPNEALSQFLKQNPCDSHVFYDCLAEWSGDGIRSYNEPEAN